MVRADDRVDPYSSRGPSWIDAFAKPDVIAPGRGLIAPAALGGTLATSYPSILVDGGSGTLNYMRLSGTSMAAAVTSGIAALMIGANRDAAAPASPQLPPNAVKAIIEFTSITLTDDSGIAYNRLVQGTGAVNAGGAIALASVIDTGSPSGASWMRSTVAPETLIGGVVNVWSQVIFWGYAQGFYFSKPLPPAAAERFMIPGSAIPSDVLRSTLGVNVH